MADGVDTIDLYAGVEDFGQQDSSDFQDTDLYDDVIISQSSENRRTDEPPKASPAQTSTSSYSGKRVAIYVGNLTWWTTDQDLTDVITGLGVNDLLEIKFYENRVNGQSKGFATVVLGSDSSSRKVMDYMPKKEIHGQIPVVTPCSRQALNQFEMNARKGDMTMQNGSHSGHSNEFATDANYRNQRSGGHSGRGSSPMGRDGPRNRGGGGSRGQRMPPMGGPPPQGPPNMGQQRPPMQGFDMQGHNNQMPPRGGPMPPPQGMPPPGMPPQGPPMRPAGPPMGMMPPRAGPPPPGVPDIRGPMPPVSGMPMQRPGMGWERPPGKCTVVTV
ncbi:Cleavage and polyadenylation specificity factor subunit 6, partial [Lamellibrachia satsuma]